MALELAVFKVFKILIKKWKLNDTLKWEKNIEPDFAGFRGWKAACCKSDCAWLPIPVVYHEVFQLSVLYNMYLLEKNIYIGRRTAYIHWTLWNTIGESVSSRHHHNKAQQGETTQSSRSGLRFLHRRRGCQLLTSPSTPFLIRRPCLTAPFTELLDLLIFLTLCDCCNAARDHKEKINAWTNQNPYIYIVGIVQLLYILRKKKKRETIPTCLAAAPAVRRQSKTKTMGVRGRHGGHTCKTQSTSTNKQKWNNQVNK